MTSNRQCMKKSCTKKIIMYNNIVSTGCLFHAADPPFHDDLLRSCSLLRCQQVRVYVSYRMHLTGGYCCIQVLNNRLMELCCTVRGCASGTDDVSYYYPGS